MLLKDRLIEDVNLALKSKERLKVSTIRLLRAAIKNREISLRKELSDEEIYSVISSLIKQRKESIEQFKKGNRDDLVANEEAECNILNSYLPKQLSNEELVKLIDTTIAEIGAIKSQDFGKVMKVIIPKVTGRADGKIVGEIVRAKLKD